MNTADAVLEALQALGEAPPRRIAQHTGLSRERVSRALRQLLKTNEVFISGEEPGHNQHLYKCVRLNSMIDDK